MAVTTRTHSVATGDSSEDEALSASGSKRPRLTSPDKDETPRPHTPPSAPTPTSQVLPLHLPPTPVTPTSGVYQASAAPATPTPMSKAAGAPPARPLKEAATPETPGPSTQQHTPPATPMSASTAVARMARASPKEEFTVGMRPYFNDRLVTRMNHMLQFADSVNHFYSMRALPAEKLEWGTQVTKSAYLCIDNEPVTVWLLGEVSSWVFDFEKKEDWRKPTTLSLHFFMEEDFVAVSNLLQKRSTTFRGYDVNKNTSSVRIKCWTRKFGAPADQKPEVFSKCVDATETWEGFSDSARRVPTSSIQQGDVVLVEAALRRSFDSGKWEAGLELVSIALLLNVPQTSVSSKVPSAPFKM